MKIVNFPVTTPQLAKAVFFVKRNPPGPGSTQSPPKCVPNIYPQFWNNPFRVPRSFLQLEAFRLANLSALLSYVKCYHQQV